MSGDLTVEQLSEDTVVRHLLDLADELERLGVDVLFCQKCVHPKMKLHLQKKVWALLYRWGLKRQIDSQCFDRASLHFIVYLVNTLGQSETSVTLN